MRSMIRRCKCAVALFRVDSTGKPLVTTALHSASGFIITRSHRTKHRKVCVMDTSAPAFAAETATSLNVSYEIGWWSSCVPLACAKTPLRLRQGVRKHGMRLLPLNSPIRCIVQYVP